MRARLEELRQITIRNEEDIKIKRQQIEENHRRQQEQHKAELAAKLRAQEELVAKQEKEKLQLDIAKTEDLQREQRREQERLNLASLSSSSSSNEQTTSAAGTNAELIPPPNRREVSTSSDDVILVGALHNNKQEQFQEEAENSTEDNIELNNLTARTLRYSATPPRDNSDEPHPAAEERTGQRAPEDNEEAQNPSPPYSPSQPSSQEPPPGTGALYDE